MSTHFRARRFAAVIALLLIAACDFAGDRDAVWFATRVFAPWSVTADGKPIDSTVRDLVARGGQPADPLSGLVQPGRKLPVVVFLHGCSGEIEGIPEEFARRGFVVFAPWSFARPDRPVSCGDVGPETLDWRLQEARWTVERLRGLPWVDPRGMVVAGASEGALATAQYADAPAEVVAFVILGWTCTDRNNVDFDGVRIPKDRAVFAAIGILDPMMSSGRLGGDCSRALEGRAQAHSMIIPALGHAMPGAGVFDEIVVFIEAARRAQSAVK